MIRPQLWLFFALLTFFSLLNLYLFWKRTPHTDLDCSLCRAKVEVATVGAGGSSRFEMASKEPRAKAAMVILARNSDADGLVETLTMFENRFNRKFNYPYVFLNDNVFDESFKSKMRQLSNSPMSFGLIPKEHWSYPSWIDEKKADASRAKMEKDRVIYGGSLSYRHMCRFNSGFFFRHELLKDYDYYWRIEPDVKFYCDTDYDPFVYMEKKKKEYGFTIMLPEFEATITTLWETTQRFIAQYPHFIHPDNNLKMFTNADGGYNLCHFWSNFEIASLKFLRSEAYMTYFDFLDRAGGFFYERWGDAPVHSLAVAMFLSKDKIHYFEDIGYYHGPYNNCPANPALSQKCSCDPLKSETINNNCFDRYLGLYARQDWPRVG